MGLWDLSGWIANAIVNLETEYLDLGQHGSELDVTFSAAEGEEAEVRVQVNNSRDEGFRGRIKSEGVYGST